MDFITNHLKAHTQNDTDFRKMIGDPKLGKLMSATIHEDGHEFSLVLNFPIRYLWLLNVKKKIVMFFHENENSFSIRQCLLFSFKVIEPDPAEKFQI